MLNITTLTLSISSMATIVQTMFALIIKYAYILPLLQPVVNKTKERILMVYLAFSTLLKILILIL